MADDPQGPLERRVAARHLVQRPLTCKEHDPDVFRLIRRHEGELDRWFTQRLGYRLHVDADSARLFKTGTVPDRRPLRTGSGRPFSQLEYVLLSLVLAATAAGPAVISLRDLVDQVRSAAAEADIDLADGHPERRALVTVLTWMITQGLATELHARVDAYATDDTADAVLKVRPDRIALVPLPSLVGAASAEELLARAERRRATRQWMRGRLVEDPVLYAEDLTEAEWGELRRRLSEEERILHEMFGLVLESRAEGVAAVDPTGSLSDRRFPAGGTLGHAALLLLDALRPDHDGPADGGTEAAVPEADVIGHVRALAARHARHWAGELVAAPERLARQVTDLLVDLRLADWVPCDDGVAERRLRLLPAAARFLPIVPEADDVDPQEALW
ncbi:MAG: TIGR02678 family protein [Acidimicrobiales bacterium]